MKRKGYWTCVSSSWFELKDMSQRIIRLIYVHIINFVNYFLLKSLFTWTMKQLFFFIFIFYLFFYFVLRFFLIDPFFLGTISTPLSIPSLWCVWYYGSFCDCDLKKIILWKVLLVEIGLVFIYIWLKLWLKLRLNKK